MAKTKTRSNSTKTKDTKPKVEKDETNATEEVKDRQLAVIAAPTIPDDMATFSRCNKLVTRIPFGKIVLREFETSRHIEGAVIIEGFPNEGVVSPLVASYIREQLDLPLIGDITSRHFAPVANVRKGQVSHGISIYGDKRVVVFESRYAINEPEIMHDISDAIYDFAARHNCRMIISSDGITKDPNQKQPMGDLVLSIADPESDEMDDEMLMGDDDGDESELMMYPQSRKDLTQLIEDALGDGKKPTCIWFVTNNSDMATRMMEIGHKPMQEGMLTGVSGALLAEAPCKNIAVVCLFAKLNKHLQIGMRASIALVHCIDSLLGGDKVIDTKKLKETATQVEEKIRNLVSKVGGLNDTKTSYENMFM